MSTDLHRIPLIAQLSEYSREQFNGDLSAGLTVGVMLIPQGMAYALIAGLPPIYGLYASLVPLVVYAIFGTSRQLAVGPVAMVSLLVAAGVAPLAHGDPDRYIELTLLLSIMIGGMQFILGLLRAGFLTNFLSHPVLSGFTSAAALIIGFSQLKHLFGISGSRSNHIHEIIGSVISGLGEIHWITVGIGAVSILVLLILRRVNRRIPGALVVVLVTTAFVWAFDLSQAGVKIVGAVPGGLPAPIIPLLDVEAMKSLFPIALTITLVGYMESIAVAKVYASRHRYKIIPNRELIALGLANLAGAFFRAYPTTGGFSRTAVNNQAGARTNLAAIISATTIAIALVFLTGLFYNLPNAVLAAIVIVAVSGLVDWKEAIYLWNVCKRDFGLMIITFLATLLLGIEEGIMVGVVVSLVIVIQQSSRPHTAIEGKIPGTKTFRNIERNPTAIVHEDVAVFRLDASFYFANAGFFKDKIHEIISKPSPPRALVLNAFAINWIDSSALHALKEIIQELNERTVDLYIAGIKGPVRDLMERANLVDEIGADRFYHEVHEAVTAATKGRYDSISDTELVL